MKTLATIALGMILNFNAFAELEERLVHFEVGAHHWGNSNPASWSLRIESESGSPLTLVGCKRIEENANHVDRASQDTPSSINIDFRTFGKRDVLVFRAIRSDRVRVSGLVSALTESRTATIDYTARVDAIHYPISLTMMQGRLMSEAEIKHDPVGGLEACNNP